MCKRSRVFYLVESQLKSCGLLSAVVVSNKASERVFEPDHDAVLQQEWHRHGTLLTLLALKSRNALWYEL